MNVYGCDDVKDECSIFFEAKPTCIEYFIFHQMKIYVLSHERKTFIICLYNIKSIYLSFIMF